MAMHFTTDSAALSSFTSVYDAVLFLFVYMRSHALHIYYLSICLLVILLLHLSSQPSQYLCIPQSGGCSGCAFAGMIERL